MEMHCHVPYSEYAPESKNKSINIRSVRRTPETSL